MKRALYITAMRCTFACGCLLAAMLSCGCRTIKTGPEWFSRAVEVANSAAREEDCRSALAAFEKAANNDCQWGALALEVYPKLVQSPVTSSNACSASVSVRELGMRRLQVLSEAAGKGDAGAELCYGFTLYKGLWQAQPDATNGLRHLAQAARSGNSRAEFYYAYASVLECSPYVFTMKIRPLEPDWIDSLLHSAAQGYAPAQYVLGRLYYVAGWNEDFAGTNLLKTTAVRWIEMSASQGYAPAEYMQGVLCCWGDGFAQDKERGSTLLLKAARQEFAPAQFQIGMNHLEGQGLTADHARGQEFIELAAANGCAQASEYLWRHSFCGKSEYALEVATAIVLLPLYIVVAPVEAIAGHDDSGISRGIPDEWAVFGDTALVRKLKDAAIRDGQRPRP